MSGGRGRQSMYLVYGASGKPARSITWKVGSSSDSFYLIPLLENGVRPRISLHAPNFGKGDGRLHFKMQIENQDSFEKSLDAGAYGFVSNLPIRFSGHRILENVTHVVTIRTTFDVVNRLPAMRPHKLRHGGAGKAIPLPTSPGMAMDVEFFYCQGAPVFPGVALYRPVDDRPVTIGPLRNESNDYLTAMVHERQVSLHSAPPVPNPGRPFDREDECRSFGMACDSDGVVWMVEQRTSWRALVRATEENLAG